MIDAAGGVIWRTGLTGGVEVLVVHRPRRADWSLPKGKQRRGETGVECAVREVREETGLICIVGERLPDTAYTDRKGRPKRVRYWTMEAMGGTFRPNREVDETRWVSLDSATELLTYPRDAAVVSSLQNALVDVA